MRRVLRPLGLCAALGIVIGTGAAYGPLGEVFHGHGLVLEGTAPVRRAGAGQPREFAITLRNPGARAVQIVGAEFC